VVILMKEKDRPEAIAPSQQPRSPRVPVEFDLEVEGTDKAGKQFQVQAKAIKISRGGATIILDVEVAVDSVVKLIPPFGRTLDARVNGAWIDKIDGRHRIGVKLIDIDGWFAE
jgi:hypothetical protein